MTNEHILLNNPSNTLVTSSHTKITSINQLLEAENINADDFDNILAFKEYRRKRYYQLLSETLLRLNDKFETYQFASALTSFSTQNPTKLTNPYWQTIVHNDLNSYDIEQALGLDISHSFYNTDNPVRAPLWGMQRMGQSSTLLPDGREILIGGEYEDGYDPQFCIYNDVIVKHPNGHCDIYGYPKHIFPPTDFHTATLVDDTIWIIGSMGYGDERQYSQTQVCQLNTTTYEITKLATVNSMGWVNDHKAEYQDGQIIISGGRLLVENPDLPMHENYDEWALNLSTLIWTNITNKQWQRFYLGRKDDDYLSVDRIRGLDFYKQHMPDSYEKEIIELTKDLGIRPNEALAQQLYQPALKHSDDDTDLPYNQVAIIVDEVRVRYVDDMTCIQVYIEGELPKEKVAIIKENLRHKLEKLENAPCEIVDF